MIRKISLTIYEPTAEDVQSLLQFNDNVLAAAEPTDIVRARIDIEQDPLDKHLQLESVITRRWKGDG